MPDISATHKNFAIYTQKAKMTEKNGTFQPAVSGPFYLLLRLITQDCVD